MTSQSSASEKKDGVDLFSEVGLDMKVDISSLATQSQSTAPTSIRVIASPANANSPDFKPQQVSQFLLEKKKGGETEEEEENNGWDDDDLDIWLVCSKKQAINQQLSTSRKTATNFITIHRNTRECIHSTR